MAGVDDLVDWELAEQTGVRLCRPGPAVGITAARQAVAELRGAAVEARGHVRAYTGLDAPAAATPVVVVDRPTWVRSNVAGLREMLAPLSARMPQRPVPAPVRSAGSKVTASEAGALLAFLSSKVLGQYEMGAPGDSGRLLLVAPNIVAAEAELDLPASDFRLWVCLHEETHRVQFGAVPWLRDHLVSAVGEVLIGVDTDPAAVGRRLVAVLGALVAAARRQPGPSLAEAVTSPAQRDAVARITAVMSLLEGHADVVMDGVGPAVVPSVATIRERFASRREATSTFDAVTRRLLGLEDKAAQYRDGARFVRAVQDAVGREGFNRVWSSPTALPSPAELADPAAWVARVVPPAS